MFSFMNNTADADLRDEAPCSASSAGTKGRRAKLEDGIAEVEAASRIPRRRCRPPPTNGQASSRCHSSGNRSRPHLKSKAVSR